MKPSLRGKSHFYACIAFSVSAVALFAMASGARAWVSVGLYAPALIALFGLSALYHLPDWQGRAEVIMRRLDHSAIFVFIAASYTPVCLLAMHQEHGILLLILVWSVALLGVLRAILWIDAPPAVCTLFYVVQGWIAIPFLPSMAMALGPLGFTMMALGGVCFTIGAAVYALRRPDPMPAVFGYHEVFHLLVIAGCGLQFYEITHLVAAAA